MASPALSTSMTSSVDEQDNFDAVVDRLKIQDALPKDCFTSEVPFFNFPPLSKEAQIRELFENSCDAESCIHLLKNIAPATHSKFVPQNYLSTSVMSFAQIVLYKVLPCSNGANCSGFPREIATHNQYKDFEYQCPFYHHERDRRRLVIYGTVDKEFVYKANYFEENRRRGDKDSYSQTYFESMFHPLYYKMFRCKREFCNISPCCPFFHSEAEKKVWDDTFSGFIRKDRVSYVKDKQNANEKKIKTRQSINTRRISDEEIAKDSKNIPHTSYYQGYRQPSSPLFYEAKSSTLKSVQPLKAWSINVKTARKDSEDSSFEEDFIHGFFSKLQGRIAH